MFNKHCSKKKLHNGIYCSPKLTRLDKMVKQQNFLNYYFTVLLT